MSTHRSHIELSPSPNGLEKTYNMIFTKESIHFLTELSSQFQSRADRIITVRKFRKLQLEITDQLPSFLSEDNVIRSNSEEASELENIPEEWNILPLPPRLQNRHLDLGDVSPSDETLLKRALLSKVQGIQVDFDDGHCPTWSNQIKGIHNIISLVNRDFFPKEVPQIEDAPLLLFRPRAWNMNEHNVMVNGKEIRGALMDFGLLIYHIGHKLLEKGVGPYFYLPKLENAKEAKLWDDIFTWTEEKLSFPHGTIKACVLIENILAAFEAERILYQLRDHSFGLNCGIWDYAASIISTFGKKKQFIIPDRHKFVNLEQGFLQSYMNLVIGICHKHSAPVTGGMIPHILSYYSTVNRKEILITILKAKQKEIQMGVDGFLTYDTDTVQVLQDLWKDSKAVSIESKREILSQDLLDIPGGGVSTLGLKKNVKVGILFIYSWLADAKGHLILDCAIEDSATAEISRWQIWQWIHHQVCLEDMDREMITKTFVDQMVWKTYTELINKEHNYNTEYLQSACDILMELVTTCHSPEFITTYLYNHSLFRNLHDT